MRKYRGRDWGPEDVNDYEVGVRVSLAKKRGIPSFLSGGCNNTEYSSVCPFGVRKSKNTTGTTTVNQLTEQEQ